jgi:sulfofructose kinase
MAANAAVAITRLGGAAAWWGRVGDDDIGSRVLDGLRREEIAVTDIRVFPGMVSSHSLVLTDRMGNRAIILYRSDALDPDPAWLPVDTVATFDAVLADNRWIEGSVAILSAARDNKKIGVLDADSGGDGRTLKAVQCASHAVFSEPGLAELFETDDPDEGLRRAGAHAPFVAVTLGASGVRWLGKDKHIRSLAAYPVNAVETVGAGDVFHGCFAFALANGESEEDALSFASAAAALKCSKSGGRSSFPDIAAVQRLVRQGRIAQ